MEERKAKRELELKAIEEKKQQEKILLEQKQAEKIAKKKVHLC